MRVTVDVSGNFAVLAGTAVTCTNGTITGNVGVSPGTAITQTSCPVTGTINAGNAAAVQANSDFFIAYDKFKALACDRTLTTFDSQTLSPGVYCVDAAATFTDAVLTLAGNGPWILKVGTLGTGALTGTRFSVVTPIRVATARLPRIANPPPTVPEFTDAMQRAERPFENRTLISA